MLCIVFGMDKPADLAELDLPRWETQLRKGALGMAVLATLWDGRRYGLEILRQLAGDGGLGAPEGTLYPLLSRLQREGLVSAAWEAAAQGHPRKYFSLTAAGRRQLAAMARAWRRFSAGVDRMIHAIPDIGADAA
jgi:PadR family transcriptional regulator PadR